MHVRFLQKMSLLVECLRDCTRALKICPSYAKVNVSFSIYLFLLSLPFFLCSYAPLLNGLSSCICTRFVVMCATMFAD